MPAAHKPDDETREQVRNYAIVGTPQEDIAAALGVSEKTLRKHYRDELDFAATEATANVGGALYRNAMSGNVAAQIFWMKTRAGWRETERLEVTGKDETPFTGFLIERAKPDTSDTD